MAQTYIHSQKLEEVLGEKKSYILTDSTSNVRGPTCSSCIATGRSLPCPPFKNSDLKGSSGYFVELSLTFQHSDIHSLVSAALPCSVSVIWRARTGPLPSKEWGLNRIAKFCWNIPRKTQEMANKAVGRRSTSFLSLPACPKKNKVLCNVKLKANSLLCSALQLSATVTERKGSTARFAQLRGRLVPLQTSAVLTWVCFHHSSEVSWAAALQPYLFYLLLTRISGWVDCNQQELPHAINSANWQLQTKMTDTWGGRAGLLWHFISIVVIDWKKKAV